MSDDPPDVLVTGCAYRCPCGPGGIVVKITKTLPDIPFAVVCPKCGSKIAWLPR